MRTITRVSGLVRISIFRSLRLTLYWSGPVVEHPWFMFAALTRTCHNLTPAIKNDDSSARPQTEKSRFSLKKMGNIGQNLDFRGPEIEAHRSVYLCSNLELFRTVSSIIFFASSTKSFLSFINLAKLINSSNNSNTKINQKSIQYLV